MARKMVKIIRKVDIEKQYARMLYLEMDYELVTLFEAMQAKDKRMMNKCKKRLTEIHKELEQLDLTDRMRRELSTLFVKRKEDM